MTKVLIYIFALHPLWWIQVSNEILTEGLPGGHTQIWASESMARPQASAHVGSAGYLLCLSEAAQSAFKLALWLQREGNEPKTAELLKSEVCSRIGLRVR